MLGTDNTPHILDSLPSYLLEIRAQVHETVARSRAVLEECKKPDTFLGRRTHEPFPEADKS
jgi:hypothetical protein